MCALRANGIVECWGQNEQGQLGQGTADWEQPTVPAPVVGLPTAARAITAGGATTCATLTDSRLWCWRYNELGQLGDGTFAARYVPGDVRIAADAPPTVAGSHK